MASIKILVSRVLVSGQSGFLTSVLELEGWPLASAEGSTGACSTGIRGGMLTCIRPVPS